MPSFVTPKKNTQFIFYIPGLISQANTKIFQVNPTLAAGDVKVVTDDGSEANIATIPTKSPAGGSRLKVTLSASEMNGDNITVTFKDVAGSEWADLGINIQTSTNQIDDSALSSVCTEARLSELDAANLPSDLGDVLDLLDNRLAINAATSELWLYNAVGDTVIKKWPLTDKDSNAIVLQGTGPANRGIQSL